MIIYMDENIPKHLAEGFHILQNPEGIKSGYPLKVKYIPTDFGKGALDKDWIPKLGELKACVITRDLNINRRKHEIELYKKSEIGVFFLKGASKKAGLSVWEMVKILSKHWNDISKAVHENNRPFAYEVTYRKLKRIS